MFARTRVADAFTGYVFHCTTCAAGECPLRGTPHGYLKDFRFTVSRFGYRFEYIPNRLMIRLIRAGMLTPAVKLPLVFGRWIIAKEKRI